MPTTFTVSSGSGDRVVVYPEGERTSSGGSASVHSPTTSESQSFSSSDSNGWTDLGPTYEDDGIEPEDSASRSRQPKASRRHTTEARPAPTRRHSSRRVVEPEEPPQRHSLHRHHSSRHSRRESRRVPSDESSSTVASYDDYPPGHHGVPPPQAYPPRSGYRHVPAQSHGGYPPSVTSAAGYPDPFQAQAQALVHMPQPDAFGYPSANPFSPGVGQSANPFSPMGSSSSSSYFTTDPHAPPMPHMPPPHQRPPPPGRPQSVYAPSSYSAYGSELTAPYHHPGMAGVPYGGIPPMAGMPGMPGMMPGMQGYPQMPYLYQPSHSSSPAPPKEEKVAETKGDGVSKEMENLRELIKKHEEERVAREKAMIAKAEADAAARAAAEAKEIEEKKKKEDIAAASAKAKEEAEKTAAEAAKAAEEEHQKLLGEAKKAQEAAEKKKKELEEEVKKNKPTPDSLKAPIKFKDAVGRKFSFPWHLCKTWKGMEGLIKQAFLHVDVIGQHVQEGHYDLCGPDGEIILPQVWDTMIQPDWEVSMHMWPMPEPEEKDAKDDKLAHDAGLADPFAGMGLDDLLQGVVPSGKKKSSKKDGSKKKKASSHDIIDVEPALSAGPGGLPPPPNFPPGIFPDLAGVFPHGVSAVEDKKSRPKAKSKSGRDLPLLAAWIAGSSRSKKDDEKLDLVRHKSVSSHAAAADQTACAVM